MVTLKNNKDLSRKICQQVRIFHSGKLSITLENLSGIQGPLGPSNQQPELLQPRATHVEQCDKGIYTCWGSGYSYWSCSFWKELQLHRPDGDLYWSVYGLVWNCRPHEMMFSFMTQTYQFSTQTAFWGKVQKNSKQSNIVPNFHPTTNTTDSESGFSAQNSDHHFNW